MRHVWTLVLVMSLVSGPGCAQIEECTGKQKKGAKGAAQKEKPKQPWEEFAGIDLKKIEEILLTGQEKKFEPWIQSLHEQYSALMPGEKPLSLQTTRSRIRTWTPRGSFTQYALNLTGYVEQNNQPGFQSGKDLRVFAFRVRHLGKDQYDFFLTGPSGKTTSKGRRTLHRKTSVARFIARKVKRRSGTYHTPEARAKALVAKRGGMAPPPPPRPSMR